MRYRLALVLALCVLGAAGLLYLSRNDPEKGGFYPHCMFREATGFLCAGCGSTRAAHALVKADVPTAFRKNPLLVIALPLLVVGVVMEGAAWILRDRYKGPRVRLSFFWAWTVPVVVFSFWILRNIPVWPFELLAPR